MSRRQGKAKIEFPRFQGDMTAAVLAQSVERETAKLDDEGSILWAGPILRVLK